MLFSAAGFWAPQTPPPLLVLGGGSNVLVADNGVKAVVAINRLCGLDSEASGGAILLTCAAGEPLDGVVEHAVARGWWGLENLSGIPGSVGATPIQNVGAYGVEVGELIASLRAYHAPTGAYRTFTPSECGFAYRDSFFKTDVGKEYVITSVTFRLQGSPAPRLAYAELSARFAGGAPPLSLIRATVLDIRSQKFPDCWRVGTAGSFFKNPILPRAEAARLRALCPALPLYEVDGERVKAPLGFVLDKICGLKGYREGPVSLYEKQALVLVADAGATARDVRAFADNIAARVREQIGLEVEWEVTSFD
jgi:UDP-N-acetylmuramate dehydrogenase